MTDEPRVCSTCRKPKPLTDYYRDRRSPRGRKVRCKACQAKAVKALRAKQPAEEEARHARKYRPRVGGVYSERAATLLSCPIDPELGMMMYSPPCRFPRQHFQETLAAGYWPDGSVWDFAIGYHGKKARWVVSGCYIREVGGSGRVAHSVFTNGEQAALNLVDAAIAAKGVT